MTIGPTDNPILLALMVLGLAMGGLLMWVQRHLARCRSRGEMALSAFIAERKADKPDTNTAIARAVDRITDSKPVRKSAE